MSAAGAADPWRKTQGKIADSGSRYFPGKGSGQQVVSNIIEGLRGTISGWVKPVPGPMQGRAPVSRTPVREALKRISDEGLIDVFAQSGTFVAPISRKALEEAYVIRTALEAESASRAAGRLTAAAAGAFAVGREGLRPPHGRVGLVGGQ